MKSREDFKPDLNITLGYITEILQRIQYIMKRDIS